MIELGKTQCLNVVKKVDFGVYLGTEEDKVLLPKKMVPEDIEAGDALTVFVYRDSSDRLIATTKTPKVQLGQLAVLEVSHICSVSIRSSSFALRSVSFRCSFRAQLVSRL